MVENKLNSMMDAFYSFEYDDRFSSREETVDANGNVKGKYAYTNELGSTIIVHYSAGPANKGFVIENEKEVEEAVDEAKEAVELAEMAMEAFNDDFDYDYVSLAKMALDAFSDPPFR